jgi:hypothetical protein
MTAQQTVNDLLGTAGLDTSDAKTNKDRPRVNAFRAELDRQVTALERQQGKQANKEQVTALADALLLDVTKNKDWLHRGTTYAFEVPTAQLPAWAKGRLAVAQIPIAAKRQIDDALRQEGKPVTDEERMKKWADYVRKGN